MAHPRNTPPPIYLSNPPLLDSLPRYVTNTPPSPPLQVVPPYASNPPPPPRQRPAPRAPRDALVELKQLLIDLFAHYRVSTRAFTEYDREARRPIRQRFRIPPNRGRWPGHPRYPPAQATARIEEVPAPGGLDPLLRPRDPRVREARSARRVGRRLEGDFRPARYRFRKVLGFGGAGAAFLFEMRDGDGVALPVVVKASMSVGRRDMQKEKENFVAMSGAQHFVQRCVLQALRLPARPISRLRRLRGLFSRLRVGNNVPPDRNADDVDDNDARDHMEVDTATASIQAARRALDQRGDIIVMEYMRRGTLHDLIARLRGNDRLSNRMLWLMFDCLFKACLAMAFPFRYCPAGRDPWSEQIVAQDETVGPDMNTPPLVHFDIDPQNALVGDFGLPGGDHGSVPIVKIGDPGLGVFATREFQTDERKLWAQRAAGKPSFFTPEQFTDEWDYEAARGMEQLRNERTAGNYWWFSNLYQVGLVMLCLITRCYPPDPPVALPYAFTDAQGVTSNRFSYGSILASAEFDACDRALRTLILRCLDHDPFFRPPPRYLFRFINNNIGRVDLRDGESDEELMENARRIFAEPP